MKQSVTTVVSPSAIGSFEEETSTLNNIQIEDLSHLVKNILTSRDSFKIEALEAKFEPRRQTVDKKSVENLLKMASNSASMLNLSVEAREADKPKVKPRQKKSFENQLTSLIQSSKVNSASTNFRVPSSRHFCGRLMSASQHSVSSSSSSSSSASITNTNEEISIESDSSGSASPNSNHYIHQRSMAKSVEFLGSKIEEIKKEKSLVNLMDVSGLSKSNKDLRNFVSNSYSPSQIVRPDQLELLKKPVVVSPLVLKPMKSERSDQVRVEYLQQEQIISKMEKKKFSELVKSSLSENAYKQVMESDDTLINCILEMKPLPSNSSTLKHATKVRPQPQPRSVSSQQNMYKNSSISSYSLSSNSNTNSNRNSINQDSSFRKVGFFLKANPIELIF
ncbi:hypothetical protein BpHYR1_027460 [Brachionus plicatilis]|uniref:Uncharacterized protein n=1 Tax=Brachionus plicatilis TaxID=10195 RepID=A0A3M7Q551_BRAPC|nr:hypothetical protein BpHYR1_027460 [Brachionus plicatilis]